MIRLRYVALLSAVVILVSVIGAPFAWNYLHMCGSVCPAKDRVFIPPTDAILLAASFGPVNGSTPSTNFDDFALESFVRVSYAPSTQENGQILYAHALAPYSIIVVERGYFAETGYKYGTDYEQLCRQGDVVVFGFAEHFVFDIYLIPAQGTMC